MLLISLVFLSAVNLLWKEQVSKQHFIVYISSLLAEHLRGRGDVIFYLIEAPAGRILHLFLLVFFPPIVFSSGKGIVISNY